MLLIAFEVEAMERTTGGQIFAKIFKSDLGKKTPSARFFWGIFYGPLKAV
jgi:hypothetical protein